jgi:hypothetical protein
MFCKSPTKVPADQTERLLDSGEVPGRVTKVTSP